jgi:hypothetical protein
MNWKIVVSFAVTCIFVTCPQYSKAKTSIPIFSVFSHQLRNNLGNIPPHLLQRTDPKIHNAPMNRIQVSKIDCSEWSDLGYDSEELCNYFSNKKPDEVILECEDFSDAGYDDYESCSYFFKKQLKIQGYSTYTDFKAGKKGGFADGAAYSAAKAAGFSAAKRFEAAKRQGYKTATDYEAGLKGGFTDEETFSAAKAAGFTDAQTYAEAQARGAATAADLKASELGFTNGKEYTEAKTRGFSDPKTYMAAKQAGFKTAADYHDGLKGGFSDGSTYLEAKAGGFNDAKTYAEARDKGIKTAVELRAIKNGFTNVSEYKEALRAGYSNANTYRSYLASKVGAEDETVSMSALIEQFSNLTFKNEATDTVATWRADESLGAGNIELRKFGKVAKVYRYQIGNGKLCIGSGNQTNCRIVYKNTFPNSSKGKDSILIVSKNEYFMRSANGTNYRWKLVGEGNQSSSSGRVYWKQFGYRGTNHTPPKGCKNSNGYIFCPRKPTQSELKQERAKLQKKVRDESKRAGYELKRRQDQREKEVASLNLRRSFFTDNTILWKTNLGGIYAFSMEYFDNNGAVTEISFSDSKIRQNKGKYVFKMVRKNERSYADYHICFSYEPKLEQQCYVMEWAGSGNTILELMGVQNDITWMLEKSIAPTSGSRSDVLKGNRLSDSSLRAEMIRRMKPKNNPKRIFEKFVEDYNWDNDVVAQVLNYSEYNNEYGYDEAKIGNPIALLGISVAYGLQNDSLQGVWYALNKKKCIYAKMSYDETGVHKKVRVLKLNDFDPRNFSILTKFTKGKNFYHVMNGQTNLFVGNMGESKERMERGWKLIYSKYCKGKKKAF